MSNCRIKLGNPGAYHPGDTVYGTVVCNFLSRESFRSIICKFRGREHTYWTEQQSYYDSYSKTTRYRTIQHIGDNKFLQTNLLLVGEGALAAGYYEYPFSFTFPPSGIPNPYNGNHGNIRYYIKATVDIPFGLDYDDEITLHLIAPLNFNNIRGELQLNPVAYQDETTVGFWCCASGPITMDFVLEKEAFVLGEVARIKVDITNLSNESITELSLTLKMVIESTTTSPDTKHRYDKELVAYTSATGVGAHGQRIYNLNFPIPKTTILPNFTRCNLFKQWCVLKAEASLPGCHNNLKTETEIKLGHIPLTDLVFQIPSTSSTFPETAGSSNVIPPPYPKEGEKAPPYPPGLPGFPVPNGVGNIDFSGIHTPGPSGSGTSNHASAPREEATPSAPSKAELAASEDFEAVDGDSEEPPPPAYTDSMLNAFSTKENVPSAPPK